MPLEPVDVSDRNVLTDTSPEWQAQSTHKQAHSIQAQADCLSIHPCMSCTDQNVGESLTYMRSQATQCHPLTED